MISIIICSRKKDINEKLKNNIKSTIGCKFELIILDNSENKYSIFEAYNLGIKKSKGIYLCFMHDDIFIHTKSWGKILDNIFSKNKQLGLIGVAGTRVKTKTPSAWWRCPVKEKRTKIIQHSQHSQAQNMEIGFKDSSIEQVAVIDGVFMAARKLDKIGFNESIGGFHNYDLNLSFEYIKNNYHVYVTNSILIEHFSAGTLNHEWLKSTYKIHDIYSNLLPLKLNKKYLDSDLEILNAKRFINECEKHQDIKIAITVWKKLFIFKPFLKFHLKFLIILITKF